MLIAGQKSTLISLEDPLIALKNGIRRYVEECVRLNYNLAYGKPIPYQHLQGYDTMPFFTAIVKDMFKGTAQPGELLDSTKLLMNDGLDREAATYLALKAFNDIISVLTLFVPDLNFTEEEYRVGITGEYDVLVCPAYEKFNDDLNSYSEFSKEYDDPKLYNFRY